MDWSTVLAAIGGSGAVVLAGAYALKKSLDATLDAGMESHKRMLDRQERLYEAQATVLTQLVERTYRLRNALRDLERNPAWEGHQQEHVQQSAQLETNYQALRDALYESRSVVPEQLFRLFHEITTPMELAMILVREQQSVKDADPARTSARMHQLSATLKKVNDIYEAVVPVVHQRLGVE